VMELMEVDGDIDPAVQMALDIIAKHPGEDSPEWVSQWSLDFGETIAAETRRRKQTKLPKK
jgi:hypothetical protein